MTRNPMTRLFVVRGVLGLAMALLSLDATPVRAAERSLILAAASSGPPSGEDADAKRTPEEKMARRFPQPVRVGDLIGLALLDWSDRTIGYVHDVVRTPDNKIQLVVPYRPWFGWVSWGGVFAWGKRPVAVPIETVAMLGRQIAALDITRKEFDAAPTFSPSQAASLGRDETFRVAITRR